MTSEQALEILCRRFPEHYAGDMVDYCMETTHWNGWDEVPTEELLVEDYILYMEVISNVRTKQSRGA